VRFARRHADGVRVALLYPEAAGRPRVAPYIVQGTVSRGQIIAYFSRRSEAEVVVAWSAVSVVRTRELRMRA
jgi:hypothetical protein